MKILFIINDAPYGSEKVFNALRLAIALKKEDPNIEIRVFLMADAVMCALPNQSTPQGYYNIEKMLRLVITRGAQIKACGTCAEARGIKRFGLIDGIEISTIDQLALWVRKSDKIITF